MNNLIKLQDNKYNKFSIDYLSSFYYPNFKIESEEKNQITVISIGTIVRIKFNNIWYDIAFIESYTFSTLLITSLQEQLYKVYTTFIKNVYIKKHFYIIDVNKDFKSIYQISEQEFLKKQFL